MKERSLSFRNRVKKVLPVAAEELLEVERSHGGVSSARLAAARKHRVSGLSKLVRDAVFVLWNIGV